MILMIINSSSEEDTYRIGKKIGQSIYGGQIIELIGDVGSGKTALTKGIAEGLGIKNTVSSPSFAICCKYNTGNNLVLAHYDFYRLTDAGIMAEELSESISRPDTITIIEWGEIVQDVLPADRITIKITAPSENARIFDISDNLELAEWFC